jgi:hypothetical protein
MAAPPSRRLSLVLFRRRESAHQRLAREGDLAFGPEPEGLRHPFGAWKDLVGMHGVPRMREWDAVVTVEAQALAGDEFRFVALGDGTLLVEEGSDGNDLTPLADAVETALAPPYRAEARRRHKDTWAVGARSIEVVRIEEEVDGDEITLSVTDGHNELLVDGERSFGSVRSLEGYGGERFDAFALTAARLDDDLWEIEAAPL